MKQKKKYFFITKRYFILYKTGERIFDNNGFYLKLNYILEEFDTIEKLEERENELADYNDDVYYAEIVYRNHTH